jgi:hypothetical protein
VAKGQQSKLCERGKHNKGQASSTAASIRQAAQYSSQTWATLSKSVCETLSLRVYRKACATLGCPASCCRHMDCCFVREITKIFLAQIFVGEAIQEKEAAN